MSQVPGNLLYTRDHEWVLVEGNTATIGITDFAQKQLGDVVFVELPEIGKQIDIQHEFGTVESVKAVSELFAPITGQITAVNQETLESEPEVLNTDPYTDGWLIKVSIKNKAELKELMNAAAYEKFIASEN